MSIAAVATAASKARQRERALARQLGRLHAICHGQGGFAGGQAPRSIGGRGEEVHLDPWMLAEIRVCALSDGTRDDRSTLVAHAAALQLKMNDDRKEFERTLTASDRVASYAAQAELMLDCALGMALLREVQRTIDEEIGRGRVEPAKNWTTLKNRLHAAAFEVKRLLAESEWRRAEALSLSLSDRPPVDPRQRQREARQQVLQELRRDKRKARIRQERIRLRARFPSRTETLAALLVVAAAIWVATVGRARFFAEELPIVRMADLTAVDGLVAVVSRPPSLYVTVDGPSWEALTEEQQNQTVRTVSGVLLEKEYRGAWFKTEAGRPVAQWLRRDGARLIRIREQQAGTGIAP